MKTIPKNGYPAFNFSTVTPSPLSLTFQLHADVETLLEAAVGAALPLGLVDDTAAVRHAGVHLLVLHRPLEEALAGLAGEQAVVVPGHLVAEGATFSCGPPLAPRKNGWGSRDGKLPVLRIQTILMRIRRVTNKNNMCCLR